MPIKVKCPRCGTENTVSDARKGQAVPCKDCGNVNVIPGTPITDEFKTHSLPVVEYRSEDLYDSVIDSVVGVYSPDGSGSGFFVDSNGILATNRHVVDGFNNIIIRPHFTNEDIYGKLIRTYKDVDLAFIKVDIKNTKYFPFETDQMRTGQAVCAIGNPLDRKWIFTDGKISSLKEEADSGAIYTHRDDYILHTAFINPGNSGGPLFSMYARIVGMNTSGKEIDRRPTGELTADGEEVVTESIIQGMFFATCADIIKEKYLQLISETPSIFDTTFCWNCFQNSKKPDHCDKCGNEFSKKGQRPSNCPTCGKPVKISDSDCPYCGTEITIE